MKHLSLTFLAIGAAGILVAAKMFHKSQEDNRTVKAAIAMVEQVKSVQDTNYVTVYRTVYVFKRPQRPRPDATFSDTSVLSIPGTDRLLGTKFADTLKSIALEDYIKPPKTFVFQDSNAYLSATVLATGIRIDSLSVPSKFQFVSKWRKNKAEISIVSMNPYITGLAPLTFIAKKSPCWLQ